MIQQFQTVYYKHYVFIWS